MAIHDHDAKKDGHIRCSSCAHKDVPGFITLEGRSEMSSMSDGDCDIKLCAKCAVSIGVQLIVEGHDCARFVYEITVLD